MTQENTLMTRQQAANTLQVSLNTLDKLCKAGLIRRVTLSRKCVRIHADDLIKYALTGTTN